MKFQLTTTKLHDSDSDCLILPILKQKTPLATIKSLDKAIQSEITQVIKKNGFTGEKGTTLFLQQLPKIKAKQILLVGCGNTTPLTPKAFRQIIMFSINKIKTLDIKKTISCLHELDIENFSLADKCRQTVISTHECFYRFDQFKTKKNPERKLKEITLVISDTKEKKTVQQAIDTGTAMANGMTLCKNLGYMPANICTPAYLATQAKTLSQSSTKLTTSIVDEKQMKKLGMGAFLAVAQGSQHPGKMIIVEYNGGKKTQKPVVLVGKSITFDTGGIDLKPSSGILEQKLDMLGGATVLGVIKAASELNLPINITGILAAAENMIGSKATRPSDIVTSLSGQTIEIMNTDAEGRLVLSDALTYCKKFKPDIVIDVATLTGAVIIALGRPYSGLISNNQALADDLIKAGKKTDDKVWQLPFDNEYNELLESNVADTANCNVKNREAGTITAAHFLSKFTKDYKWAHIDIACTASERSDQKPTGRNIPLLTQYLINYAKR